MDLIVDFSNARLAMSAKELDDFVGNFINSDRSLIGRAAVLVDRPMETALSMIIAEKMAGHQLIGVFTTMEGARTFLGKK